MIVLFSIANIKYLKGVFFPPKNMKASKFSITFGNSSSCCMQAPVPEDRGEAETAVQELLDTEQGPGWEMLWTGRRVPCLGAARGCCCLGEAQCSWHSGIPVL